MTTSKRSAFDGTSNTTSVGRVPRTGRCSACSQRYSLNRDGLLKLHPFEGATCDGSARPPAKRAAPPPQDPTARLPATALRRAMLERDQWRCRKCGFHSPTGSMLEPHHVAPFASGGKTELDNLHTLCGHCHAELSWLWSNAPPVAYEEWLRLPTATFVMRLLLSVARIAPFELEGTPLPAELFETIIGIDETTARRILAGRSR